MTPLYLVDLLRQDEDARRIRRARRRRQLVAWIRAAVLAIAVAVVAVVLALVIAPS